MRRRILLGVALIVLVLSTWLGVTNDLRIWPVRNTLQYYLFQRWDRIFGRSAGPPSLVQGLVRTPQGQPVVHARVMVADHNGTTYSAESDAAGHVTLRDVPAGEYVPIAGARGYADDAIRDLGLMRVELPTSQPLDIHLAPLPTPTPIPVPPTFRLDPPEALQIAKPLPATAIRRAVHFEVNSRHNQTTLYYTPNDGKDQPVPVLLTVYPGAADTWESVSLPLAQAGYAVIAVGPDYALDLEPDIDDLERVLNALRAGRFPRADARHIGALGGSYSSLHVFRLLERHDQPIQAALFLGPPTDLFELRREFNVGEIFPPFGLDKAAIALGFPDRNPEPYWRYSARFHARDFDLPLMLVHSKQDEVIPFPQSQLLSDELTRIGTPHELHILEGMGHYLLATERTPSVDALFNLTIHFFEQHLR